VVQPKLLKGIIMRYYKKIIVSIPLLFIGIFSVVPTVSANGCNEYTQAPSSHSPQLLTIIDTEVGTDAYQRLVTYSSGGHKTIGMAIAGSYDYFGQCQFVGIGIMDGSGGNGHRPNYTLAIWHEGVDLTTARSVIFMLIGASATPVVTNGDCNISCDGTTGRQFDGTIVNESTTTTTTIQQVANIPLIIVEPTVQESVSIVQESEQPLSELVTTSVTVGTVTELTSANNEVHLISASTSFFNEPAKSITSKKSKVTNKKKIKKVVVRRK
jgi:hypothetical protein